MCPPGSQGSAPIAHPEDELERLTKKMLFDMDNPPSDEYFGEKARPTHTWLALAVVIQGSKSQRIHDACIYHLAIDSTEFFVFVSRFLFGGKQDSCVYFVCLFLHLACCHFPSLACYSAGICVLSDWELGHI